MKTSTPTTTAHASTIDTRELVHDSWGDVGASFDRFCVMAGIDAMKTIMNEDAATLAGERYGRDPDKPGYRWGTTSGQVGFQGGRIRIERPRVRDKETGQELSLPSWEEIRDGGYLEEWATSLMLMNVSTRKFRGAVRLPEAGVPDDPGSGLSRSAVSRRFKALTEERFHEWMSSDISGLDLLVIQIDGMHMTDNLLMVGAIGVDAGGHKHPLGVVEGATENTATVQALLENLIERGLDPSAHRLFVLDGAKALSGAVRRTFGAGTAIQRCRVHKGRNIVDRLPKRLHASCCQALRQAWELDDADTAERLLRNLARRLEKDAPGVSGSILEGLDEILTVTRLGLPKELRRALATTNMIESAHSMVRQTCRNVKRWRGAGMALRWTGAGMLEAGKRMRRLRAYRQLPILRAALEHHHRDAAKSTDIDQHARAA